LSCSPEISPDTTNLAGTLFISELLEVRAGGCGGLAPRPPLERDLFFLIFSKSFSLLSQLSGSRFHFSTETTNLPDPLVISELLEVRAGGCGGLAPRPPGKRLVCFEIILILSEISGPAV